MNILKKGFAVVLCLLLGNILMAQPANDWMLANQYFNAGEYEKALVYFEKRYDFDPMGSYEGYLKCFIALRQYSEAEKLIKKHIKKAITMPHFMLIGVRFTKYNWTMPKPKSIMIKP
ncbi:MAG: hypothetical protein IPP29_14000 [Bacteroidetes bacterium]|nr:hypothetical protein [Bacteroidota bacterium]